MSIDSTDQQLAKDIVASKARLAAEIKKRVVGQDAVVEQLLVTLFAGGHALFVGVPGLAKTLLISTLAEALALEFNRVQFTPDLMPSDITGTDVLDVDEAQRRSFRFVKGPLFCNLLLADEINRTPPKTQAALLQAMQEKRVTVGGKTYPLGQPFHVFATQNPIEQEGTYPLPEAQLDRFMLMIDVDYPTLEEEIAIVDAAGPKGDAVAPVLDPTALMRFQALVPRVPVAASVTEFAVKLIRSTRPSESGAPDLVKSYVSFGAGPRSAQHLVTAARARALLSGRFTVDIDDIKALARPVLQHRIIMNFRGESERMSSASLVQRLLQTVG